MLINLNNRSDGLRLQDAADHASAGDRIVLTEARQESATINTDGLIIEGSPYTQGTMTIGAGVHDATFLSHPFLNPGGAPPFDYTDTITFDIFANDDGVDVTLSGLNATFHGGAGDDVFHDEMVSPIYLFNRGGESAIAHGGGGDDTLFIDDTTLNRAMTNSIRADGTSGSITGGSTLFSTTVDQLISYDGFEHLHLVGGSAADTLTGTANSDTLAGGAGADSLSGGGGDDRLLGGNGDDRLSGGAGRDYLSGGAGSDTFVFGPGSSGIGGLSRDYIADFQSGIDHIDLTALGSSASFSTTTVGSDALIRIDANGDGTEDMQIQVRFSSVFVDGDIVI